MGDGNGENAVWLRSQAARLHLATFKCRSTPTGTLPTDQDLFNTIARGLTNSNMPIWNTFTKQQRADLVAYIKTFSPRWEKEKAGDPIKIPAEPAVTMESICSRQELCSRSWSAGSVTARKEKATVRRLQLSPIARISPFGRINFARAGMTPASSAVSTNQDIYKIFMTGVDGTPMPSFADMIQPNDAWDLVHFLRTLQVAQRHSKGKREC